MFRWVKVRKFERGLLFRDGDFVRLLPGSKHSSHTPNGCTLLVMLRGNNRALSEDEVEELGSGERPEKALAVKAEGKLATTWGKVNLITAAKYN